MASIELADRLSGKHVVRAGITLTVEAIDQTARKVTVATAQGAEEIMGFNIIFKEPIVIVKPTHLLESLNIDEINASWIGRFLYRDGDRWKILKVAELLGCRGHC